MTNKIINILSIWCMLFTITSAIDEIKFEKGQGKKDVRMQFKLEILEEALKKTYDEYGEYIITNSDLKMNNYRAIKEMERENGSLNTFIALTNYDWEEKTIPIRIPIRRGILNYRLLLIRREDEHEFSQIKTIDDLKKKRLGSKYAWSLTTVMSTLGFDPLIAPDYDGLFGMLNSGRYDYLPRGVNEIFAEYEQKKDKLENIMIEPNLLLVIPSPTYVFVSKHNSRLAKRLKKGLELMLEDGTLKKIFDKYYSENIKKAKLKNRHVIDTGNPLLPKSVPLHKKEYWVDLLEY